jgi:hypothetical protein
VEIALKHDDMQKLIMILIMSLFLTLEVFCIYKEFSVDFTVLLKLKSNLRTVFH